ncbi:outer membrane beta-barrel protein [Chitinophaga sp. Cy-1792]|uniref:outer membrane beta-barrel protein n=1 Tax=Chitinophaga sp. Cy-1792 TaxID=2608339 RepID=UPI00141E21AD|nr:TonB-dependent receptor [Chitinophaga sp. Cy-1792]
MKYLVFSFLAISLILNCIIVEGQVKNSSTNIGSIKGAVKDSTQNFVLSSATVAVYNLSDTTLIQFTIPNNFGEFTISALPLDIPLQLVISHIGYKSLTYIFTLDKNRTIINTGTLYIHQFTAEDKGGRLQEVQITALAPVRMNGDTLEFNADAFRLDTAATTEDLIRRLPGFTIWGDGDITFNGKKINAVTVDGKPFMGGSITSVTQNLPKNAVNKLQVYQQANEKNPLDSTMFANIILKEDKKSGYFGKAAAGLGTDKRYAADVMLSGYNKKLQSSLVAATNNINKLADNVDLLFKSSAFKSDGINVDYQSNFNMNGLNKPVMAGARFQYDFVPQVAFQTTNRLKWDYFLNNNTNQTLETGRGITFLGPDSTITRDFHNNSFSNTTKHAFNAQYEKSTEYNVLKISGTANALNDNKTAENNSIISRTADGIISSSHTMTDTHNNSWDINLGMDYTKRQNPYDKKRVSKAFSFSYFFKTAGKYGNSKNVSDFTSTTSPTANMTFDRLYSRLNESGFAHTFNIIYPGLKPLIFGRNTNLAGITMSAITQVLLQNQVNDDIVLDRDLLKGDYTINNYLSNHRKAYRQDFTPGLSFTRTIMRGLTNRYGRYAYIEVNVKNKFFKYRNEGAQNIQNFNYAYSTFVPDASFTYTDHQYGNYELKSNLNYNRNVNFPDANKIAPLTDSSNTTYIYKGNPGLKPEYETKISASQELITRKSKNPFSAVLAFNYLSIKDKMIDSLVYDSLGRQVIYAANHDGYRNIVVTGTLKKAIEKLTKTYEINGRYILTFVKYPQFINGTMNLSNGVNQSEVLGLSFRVRDFLNFSLEEGIDFYATVQQGYKSNTFKSFNQHAKFAGSIQFPVNVIWNSNITYNKNSSNNTTPIYYTIWNASVAYRFLPANKGEIKISALDLLHENKGIINNINGNTQFFTVNNVLRQYFMITLSYYPRKFGK